MPAAHSKISVAVLAAALAGGGRKRGYGDLVVLQRDLHETERQRLVTGTN